MGDREALRKGKTPQLDHDAPRATPAPLQQTLF
jgi:hypothetical protein